MSVTYDVVHWTKQKKIYDRVLAFSIFLVLISFSLAQFIIAPEITIETLIIRATAFTAFLLLHVILLIGPLCRLNTRFLPLLYNRRHLGVSMFLLALIHGVFSIIQFHALGDVNPIASVFLSNQNYQEISEFPFQILGLTALSILFLMAATSHDFWLKNLSPKIWKALHMMVYLAYILIVLHVALGTLQYEDHIIYKVLLSGGFLSISGLHLIAGWKEYKSTTVQLKELKEEGFYLACHINDIEENCAKIVFVNQENIAVFKYDNKVSAVHNVCRHQMGPLGEGRVIDGCITCPWHGYQYLPENGQSPPPFDEKVSTYRVKVVQDQVWIHPKPLDPGTPISPALINP